MAATKLANTVIAGVNKAGTTGLYVALSSHPQIAPSSVKETRYFLPLRYGRSPAPISEYASYFAGVFVGVFAASIRASLSDTLDRQFVGDIAIVNTDGFSPIPTKIAEEVERDRGRRCRSRR